MELKRYGWAVKTLEHMVISNIGQSPSIAFTNLWYLQIWSLEISFLTKAYTSKQLGYSKCYKFEIGFISMVVRSWCYTGRDIGVNLPTLLNALVAELPADASTMLRIGMTNPPFILEHLKEIAEVLRHPCVYSFLHVPVQSGSDAILSVSQKLLIRLWIMIW